MSSLERGRLTSSTDSHRLQIDIVNLHHFDSYSYTYIVRCTFLKYNTLLADVDISTINLHKLTIQIQFSEYIITLQSASSHPLQKDMKIGGSVASGNSKRKKMKRYVKNYEFLLLQVAGPDVNLS